jgi:hypothetical protein
MTKASNVFIIEAKFLIDYANANTLAYYITKLIAVMRIFIANASNVFIIEAKF